MLHWACCVDEAQCVFGNHGFRLLFSVVRARAGFKIILSLLLQCSKDTVRGFAGDGYLDGCGIFVDLNRA